MNPAIELIVEQNILLKSLSVEEVKTLFNAVNLNRLYLRQWLPWVDYTLNESDTSVFLKDSENSVKPLNSIIFAIMYKNDFAGTISLDDINYTHKHATLSYWLQERYQHKGIMTKAVDQLTLYAFQNLDLIRVQILCEKGNENSKAIPERLNFENEGTLREFKLVDKKYIDMIVYSKLKNIIDSEMFKDKILTYSE